MTKQVSKLKIITENNSLIKADVEGSIFKLIQVGILTAMNQKDSEDITGEVSFNGKDAEIANQLTIDVIAKARGKSDR